VSFLASWVFPQPFQLPAAFSPDRGPIWLPANLEVVPPFRCETLPAARRFCDRSKLFLLAASLGGVESLIVLPIYTSHHRMNQAELSAAGVKPGTVRMSVGLEAPRDLRADLLQALA